MLQNIKKRSEGFTIIEVMIVLAIAALILVVVLVAVPQLQRNQRNSARRDVLSRVKTEVDNFSGNNNGSIPGGNGCTPPASGQDNCFTSGFKTRYLTGVNYNDPSTGSAFSLAAQLTSAIATPSSGRIDYYANAKCSGETVAAGGGARFYALVVGLEGGSGAAFCVDNH